MEPTSYNTSNNGNLINPSLFINKLDEWSPDDAKNFILSGGKILELAEKIQLRLSFIQDKEQKNQLLDRLRIATETREEMPLNTHAGESIPHRHIEVAEAKMILEQHQVKTTPTDMEKDIVIKTPAINRVNNSWKRSSNTMREIPPAYQNPFAAVSAEAVIEPDFKKPTLPTNSPLSQTSSSSNAPRNFNKEFEALALRSKQIKHSFTKAQDPYNKHKNRYPDILANDEHRITIDGKPFYYINGDMVKFKDNDYLITQGPKRETLFDFWEALIFKNVHTVVAAVMAVEQDRMKCHDYWSQQKPLDLMNGWVVNVPTVTPLEGVVGNQSIIKREFIVEHKETGEKRTITQLHYQNWPDHGIPNLDLLGKLVTNMDEIAAGNPTKSPVAIHCSAGIGRSGVIAVAHAAKKEIIAGNEPDASEMIFQMRHYRSHLVQTADQYKTLVEYMQKLKVNS